MGRFCFRYTIWHSHASYTRSNWNEQCSSFMAFGILSCCFFSYVSEQRIFFLLIKKKKNFCRLINSYSSPFRWSRRMHWPIFVIDTVCIALAFVVYVDGGGHIYLSFSSYGARCYCCHTILRTACSQREPYYTSGRLSSELILLKSDSCSFSVCFAFEFVIVYIFSGRKKCIFRRFSSSSTFISVTGQIVRFS